MDEQSDIQIIKNIFGDVLHRVDAPTLKAAIEKERADLRGAYLRGADLQGADLQGADLQGADLRGADLQGADLRGADLRGAYLRGAYLQGAYLQGADLRGADLRETRIGDCIFNRAPLQFIGLQFPIMEIGIDLFSIGCNTWSVDQLENHYRDNYQGEVKDPVQRELLLSIIKHMRVMQDKLGGVEPYVEQEAETDKATTP